MKYRIKEVRIPFKTGEQILFYPQACNPVTKSTGMLWWKKTIEIENWEVFYHDKNGKLQTKILNHYTDSNIKYIRCESKDEAQYIINEYDKYLKELSIEFWSEHAIEWHDPKYVNIHEVKMPENK